MIPIDTVWAISLYIFFGLALVIGKWMSYNCNGDKEIFERSEFLQQCPYCTHLYFDYQRSPLKVCPRCQSYLSVDPEKERKS